MDSRCQIPKFLPAFQATLTSTSSNSGVQYVIQFTLLTSQIHEIESQLLAIFNGTEVFVEDVQVAATVLGVKITVVGIAVIKGEATAVTSRETLRAVYSCQLLETSRSVWRSEDS